MYAKKCPKQGKAKRDDVINPQNYNFKDPGANPSYMHEWQDLKTAVKNQGKNQHQSKLQNQKSDHLDVVTLINL